MRIVFFWCLILCAFSLNAENDSLPTVPELSYDTTEVTPLEFDQKDLERYRNSSDFNYLEELEPSEGFFAALSRWINNKWNAFIQWLFGDVQLTGFLSFLVRALPYILIGGLLGLIVYLFIRFNPGEAARNGQELPQVFLTEDDKIIRSKNIDDLITQALAIKNYRLAVRYYYLRMLQMLKEKDVIKYEAQKTNADYATELADSNLSASFKELTKIYDYTWYGNFKVDETDHKFAQQKFNQLNDQLTQ